MSFKRWIEDRTYYREKVVFAEVKSAENSRLLLKANAVFSAYKNASSDNNDMFARQETAKSGEYIEYTICIDFLERDSVRVRFSKGSNILENDTLMVQDQFKLADRCVFAFEKDKVVATTDNLCANIYLEPYSIEIVNLKTGEKAEVGGKEKNYFNVHDSLNTSICSVNDETLPVATENFTLTPNEAIYGFGEKFLKLNKVGQTIDINECDGLGTGTSRTYKNVPFYVSTNGYGVFFNQSSTMTFWVGSKFAGDVQVAVEDDFLDYYIFMGDIKTVLDNYTCLTGKCTMPPMWSFGYWQSKISYQSAEETIEIIDKFRENKIPCDVIHIDTHWFKEDWVCDWTFDKLRFPDVKGYIKELADKGVKLSLWQLPYVRGKSKAFEAFNSVDGFVKTAIGDLYDQRNDNIQESEQEDPIAVIDFTNPKAVELYKDYLRALFKMGVKVIKTDFGEAAPIDGVYYDGTPGHRMHNLYPLIYNKIVFELTQELTGEGIVWSRSAYAGSQRYPVHWGGDNSPNYYNMIPQLAGGLSLGLSGFTFWSQDLGGFLGETNDELFIRWMQYSVLMSHIRVHGLGERELYKFGDECVRICKEYLNLRYRLLPYLWGSSIDSCKRGLPITRALVIDYQNDRNVWHIEDQYLSGEYLMVAPIYTESGKRMVYFPSGVWTDWHTGEKIKGNVWKEISVDIETLPLYAKEGAIIPLGPTMNYVGEKKLEEIELRIFPFANDGVSEFVIPVDGEQISITYCAKEGKHTVKISPTNIKFNIISIGEEHIEY